MAGEVRFYFDFISPFAYIAWHDLQGLAVGHNLSIRPVPVLFAGLLNAHNNLGPAEVEAKRRYIFKHCQRLAALRGLPFDAPPTHPFRPLISLRTAIALDHNPKQAAVIERLLNRVWGAGAAIDDAAGIEAVLKASGIDPEPLLAEIQTDAVKQALADNTQQAVKSGVFGVPTCEYQSELYWGVDAIPTLIAAITQSRAPEPQAAAAYERWCSIEASAARKRG